MYLTKKEAIDYLQIDEKEFTNYHKFSGELRGIKGGEGDFKGHKNWWYFNKDELDFWKEKKNFNTVNLDLSEYESCFEFALKLVYGGSSLGRRSEVQASDNWITGRMAEYGFKKLMLSKFGLEITLDEDVHPDEITPQDVVGIKEDSTIREPKLFIGVKSSKMKSAYLIADEHGIEGRSADVYVFARVGLPRDHLFRYLRDHSCIQRANNFLIENADFEPIKELNQLPVWICGFCYSDELNYVKEIPGQEFEEHRYVKSVSQLHDNKEDWEELIRVI